MKRLDKTRKREKNFALLFIIDMASAALSKRALALPRRLGTWRRDMLREEEMARCGTSKPRLTGRFSGRFGRACTVMVSWLCLPLFFRVVVRGIDKGDEWDFR